MSQERNSNTQPLPDTQETAEEVLAAMSAFLSQAHLAPHYSQGARGLGEHLLEALPKPLRFGHTTPTDDAKSATEMMRHAAKAALQKGIIKPNIDTQALERTRKAAGQTNASEKPDKEA